MKRFCVACFFATAALLLVGCGSGELSGTYEGDNAMVATTLRFEGEKIHFGVMGQEVAMPYEREGERIFVGNETAQQVFTINDDGTISGGGQTFTKADD